MVAVLAELIGVLKKIRICRGGTLIVEPSTGSDPTTKDEANAACGRNSAGNQLSDSNAQRPTVASSVGLRKRPFCIKSFVVVRVITPCEIVHQLQFASNNLRIASILFFINYNCNIGNNCNKCDICDKVWEPSSECFRRKFYDEAGGRRTGQAPTFQE